MFAPKRNIQRPTSDNNLATPRASTRRRVLGAMLGGVAGSTLPSGIVTASSNGPPAFGTMRHQFTSLRPVKVVPDIRLVSLEGKIVPFAQFRNKVVLVNFWATWCPACRTELPALERLQMSARSWGVQVIAISLDRGGRSAVGPFLRRLGVRHLDVFLDPEGRTARPGGEADVPFALYGMPVSYLVGPTGRIEGYLTGEADWSSQQARDLLLYFSRAE